MELDSQALVRPQSTLDSSAYFRPAFQLRGSAGHLACAPIKLFQPRGGRIRVFGFVEALNEFRR